MGGGQCSLAGPSCSLLPRLASHRCPGSLSALVPVRVSSFGSRGSALALGSSLVRAQPHWSCFLELLWPEKSLEEFPESVGASRGRGSMGSDGKEATSGASIISTWVM